MKNTLIAAHDPVKCTPKRTNLGTTWVGVPTEETPYISHFCKRYEIDVLIAYT